jgi:hypothetical protein
MKMYSSCPRFHSEENALSEATITNTTRLAGSFFSSLPGGPPCRPGVLHYIFSLSVRGWGWREDAKGRVSVEKKRMWQDKEQNCEKSLPGKKTKPVRMDPNFIDCFKSRLYSSVISSVDTFIYKGEIKEEAKNFLLSSYLGPSPSPSPSPLILVQEFGA